MSPFYLFVYLCIKGAAAPGGFASFFSIPCFFSSLMRISESDWRCLEEVPEAIKKAVEVGLDLVEVSPQVDPPVCKILDFGKFKYEAQKKASTSKKKQKEVTIKELNLHEQRNRIK